MAHMHLLLCDPCVLSEPQRISSGDKGDIHTAPHCRAGSRDLGNSLLNFQRVIPQDAPYGASM